MSAADPTRQLPAGLSAFDLSGRVALVYGASRGIGRALAEALAAAGASVALAARSTEGLEAGTALIRERGGTAVPFVSDARRADRMAPLVEDVVARMGGLDVLLYVAGMTVRAPALETREEDWDAILSVNLKSAFFLAQAAGRYWVGSQRFEPSGERGKGKVIFIASLTSALGIRATSPYAASKAGILGVTRTLATEWAPLGICVNAIAPGYVETELTRPLFEDPERGPWIHSRIPMGRRSYPEDLAGAAVFLSSRASDYLTGQTIYVDGGWTAA